MWSLSLLCYEDAMECYVVENNKNFHSDTKCIQTESFPRRVRTFATQTKNVTQNYFSAQFFSYRRDDLKMTEKCQCECTRNESNIDESDFERTLNSLMTEVSIK